MQLTWGAFALADFTFTLIGFKGGPDPNAEVLKLHK